MLSVPHLIIIFVVALVVFGPEKLPDLARNLGKMMGEFRRATADLRSTFEGHLRDLEREAEQRRIDGAKPAPTPPSPTSPGLTEADFGLGTVPADPPYAAAAGAADDEFPLKAPSVTGSQSPGGADLNEPTKAESEKQIETVSDGGQRPA